MRLATVKVASPRTQSEKRDGRLFVVSSDGNMAAPVEQYPTLISALEDWACALPILQEVALHLERGRTPASVRAESLTFMAPLPRTYAFLDASAYLSHVRLARKARNAPIPPDLETIPLMYQGLSDTFLGPREDIPAFDPDLAIDFEGEFAVVLDDVPIGTRAHDAHRHVKLCLLLNDISLRTPGKRETETGFGFIQGKPASSFAPFAVTPDELGDAWSDGRINLAVRCSLNGTLIGTPHGKAMHFSFFELIAHAAGTRALSAGTILGGGTVSNDDATSGVACLVEKRMRELLESGESKTPFLKGGDLIEIDCLQEGRSIFGRIEQRVRTS